MLKNKGPNTEPCEIHIFIDVVVDIVEFDKLNAFVDNL